MTSNVLEMLEMPTVDVAPRGRAWEESRAREKKFLRFRQLRQQWTRREEKSLRLPAPQLRTAPVWDIAIARNLAHNGLTTPFSSPLTGGDSSSGGVTIPPDQPDSYSMVAITAASGTDPDPDGDNEYTIPTGYNGLAIWITERPSAEFYVSLIIKIDDTTLDPCKVYRNQCLIIRAAADAVVSFASQVRLKTGFTLSSQAVVFAAAPIITPADLDVPSAVTGSANCDRATATQSGDPIWEPTVAGAHITLAGENQVIQVDAASGHRYLLVVEFDADDSGSPIRFVYVPPNEDVRIQCKYKKIALANIDGAAVDITAPTGATIGGTSTEWEPDFTAATSTTFTTAAGFKTAINGSADDIIGDVSGGPLTIDLSGAGLPMNSTNYAAGMARTLRIRASSGNPADLTFTGTAGWNVVVAAGQRWVFGAMTVDITSNTTGFKITGRADGAHVHITGTPTGGTTSSLALVGAASFGSLINTFAWGEISGAIEDAVDLSQDSGQAAETTIGRIIGYTINGNGASANNSQVLTSHNASSVEAYGCHITDVGLTSNQVIIAGDASSFVYLFFCHSASADITHTVGMSIVAQGVFFCDFGAVQRFNVGLSGVSSAAGGYLIGTTATQRVTTAIGITISEQVNVTPYIGGCTFTTDTDSGCHGFDCRTNVEIVGNQVTMGGTTTSSIGLRVNTGSPGAGSWVRFYNNHLKCATSGARLIELAASANISLDLKNNIFDEGAGSYSVAPVGGTGTTDNIAANNYFGTSSYPTNFTARFTATGSITANVDGANNYWSGGTDPGLEADGTPSVSGLCDNEGADLGLLGGIDRKGRILRLGDDFVRGPVEMPIIKASAPLYPVLW